MVEDDRVEQIKGITYSLDALLGYNPYKPIPINGHSYIPQQGNKLYSAVIYLAPGDYHRFHSPTEWNLKTIRHFAGYFDHNCR
jgi:phosphatidylserine decarboxylase